MNQILTPMKWSFKSSKINWRYVFGELLLIVCGILIALYINNANEIRKTKDFEKQITREIHKSLSNDLDFHIATRIKRAKQIIESADIILQYLNNKQAYHDSLEMHFWRMNWIINFEPQTIPFERLKWKGIEIVSDEKNRLSLLQLYDYEYPRIKYFSEDLNTWSSNRVEAFCLANFEIVIDQNNKRFKPLNSENLRQNILYKNLVIEKRSRTNYLKSRLEFTQNNIRTLLNSLDD